MSIEGLLSIRGDASGAVAELRKISEGLGQVREKGMRAGSGIASAIGSISGALIKFNFVVAGISTAFEVLKAGAAVAKSIWDRWGISPSVKAEIAWLEKQRKANEEWEKRHASSESVNQRIGAGITKLDDSTIRYAAQILAIGRKKYMGVEDEGEFDKIYKVFTDVYASPSLQKGLNKALAEWGIDFYATGEPARDRAKLLETFEAIRKNTGGFAKWNEEAHIGQTYDPANSKIDYDAQVDQERRDDAREKAEEAAKAKRAGRGGGAATDVAGRPIIDWTIRPDTVVIESPAKIEIDTSALNSGGYDSEGLLRNRFVGAPIGSSARNAASGIFGQLASQGEDSMLAGMDKWRSSLTTTATAYNAFSDAMAAGVDAAISGQESIGKAIMGAAAQSLRAKAVQATVEALWETALGVADAAKGLPTAAGHFAAAGKFAAVAALAGAGSAALGHAVGSVSASGGTGASAPAARSPARERDEGVNVVVNIGHGFVGSERDLGDTIARAVASAQRGGRAKGAPRWE